jgi:long-chain acyl-CoA synthetase
MSNLTLPGLLRQHAKGRTDHICLHYMGCEVTYGELDKRASRLASTLIVEGVKSGDRIAMLDKNSPECFEVMFGAAKCGAVYVPINWRLAVPEIVSILQDAEVKILILAAEFERLAPQISALVPSLTSIYVIGGLDRESNYEYWVEKHEAIDPGFDGGPEVIVMIMYTSGTSGAPKGVMITNLSLLGRMDESAELWRFDAESVQLIVMPLFHIGATSMALEAMVQGGTNVVMKEFDATQMLESIERYRITNMLLVPAIIQFLVDSPECEKTDWSSMRTLIYGAAPISEALLARAVKVMRCNFEQIYGMTEHCGCVCRLSPDDHSSNDFELLRSCGTPLPWVEVRVIDLDSKVDLLNGESGEIWVRSNQLMLGYWGNTDLSSEVLTEDGWYRTGDVGYLDSQGYLYIRDRVKDMIISGGENIYPAEIENILASYNGITEAAVIAVPDPKWGETPKAFVVVGAGVNVTEKEIAMFCRNNLAGFKCPSSFEFVDALPRNASGKILKKQLREPYWRDINRNIG